MARATIPYEDIQAKLETMFPWPTYKTVRIRKPRRDNEVRAPTSVYDRRTGNFKSMGYRVQIILERFVGLSEDLTYTEWVQERMVVIVEV
jgi:hypothetical protein